MTVGAFTGIDCLNERAEIFLAGPAGQPGNVDGPHINGRVSGRYEVEGRRGWQM